MAYDDRDGKRLWEVEMSVGIMAPPISYAVDGVQYVAVVGGLGGSHGGHFSPMTTRNDGRIFAFRLGSEAPMPTPEMKPPFEVRYSPDAPPEEAAVDRGRALFARHCFRCHGIGAVTRGIYTDLRASTPEVHESWQSIVLGGTRQSKGMPSFGDLIDEQGAEDIRSYVVSRALHEPTLVERAGRSLLRWSCIPARWATD